MKWKHWTKRHAEDRLVWEKVTGVVSINCSCADRLGHHVSFCMSSRQVDCSWVWVLLWPSLGQQREVLRSSCHLVAAQSFCSLVLQRRDGMMACTRFPASLSSLVVATRLRWGVYQVTMGFGMLQGW